MFRLDSQTIAPVGLLKGRRRRSPTSPSIKGVECFRNRFVRTDFMSVSTMQTASHGPGLSRMHTAPTMATRANSINPYPNGMGHTPRSSTLSGATAYSSASSTSLSSMSSSATLVPTSNGGPVVATNNIINQRADASRSLYQICLNSTQRLRQVPGFDQHLADLDEEEDVEEMAMDPMSSLWRCLRKGYPLLTIYNCLQPTTPLTIDEKKIPAKNIPKRAAFQFVQACLVELKLRPDECFVLTDLFGDDTTGFVKVSLASFYNISSLRVLPSGMTRLRSDARCYISLTLSRHYNSARNRLGNVYLQRARSPKSSTRFLTSPKSEVFS